MSYNYSMLLSRIKAYCGSQAVFACKMKLSERTMSLKLNNKIEWKQSEIIKACDILDINITDIPLFFYTECSKI